jgi:hypothetical protein
MLKITHNAGFFSCCFVKLYKIIEFYKNNKHLPIEVDSSCQFEQYKKANIDITFLFFEHYDHICEELNIDSNNHIISWDEQFIDYKTVNYHDISPFVRKYFTPSSHIESIRTNLQSRYNIDLDNCIGLYYRGTDKISETQIDSFESYYHKLNEVINENPNIQVVVQTDSMYFLEYMREKCLQNIIIIAENSTSSTDRGIHHEKQNHENYSDIQYLFATFLLISKCKYIICSSSNGSIWMMYYRGNARNVYQNLNKHWL